MQFGIPPETKEKLEFLFETYARYIKIALVDDNKGTRIMIQVEGDVVIPPSRTTDPEVRKKLTREADKCSLSTLRKLEQLFKEYQINDIEFRGHRTPGEYNRMGPDTPPHATGEYTIWFN